MKAKAVRLGRACIITCALFFVFETKANPIFDVSQPVAGYSVNRLAFMTAWNLSTGAISISPSWSNGRYVWNHPATNWRQWIARFTYDQATGQTTSLAWYFDQPHVQ